MNQLHRVTELCKHFNSFHIRDQLLESHNRHSKKYKWTHKFYDHILGVTIVNCLIVKRCLSKENLRMHMLEFRLQLVQQLRIVAISDKVENYLKLVR